MATDDDDGDGVLASRGRPTGGANDNPANLFDAAETGVPKYDDGCGDE